MQLGLFDAGPSVADLAFSGVIRHELGRGAWLELGLGWVKGQAELFWSLRREVQWEHHQTQMYERTLAVPRLLGKPNPAGASWPMLTAMQRALSHRYGRVLDSVSLAFYRGGDDSVAMHSDKMGALVDDTVIAIVSVGGARSFLLKPRQGGPSRRLRLGSGDLLVMGGTCQRHWLHGVPKARRAEPRLSIMFREQVPETQNATQTWPSQSDDATLNGDARSRRGSNNRDRVAVGGASVQGIRTG